MRKVFIHGLISGLIAALAACVYNWMYAYTLGTDFGKVINLPGLISINILAALLISFGYYALTKVVKRLTDVWFNIALTVLTFSSLIIPIAISLPLDIKNPELFLGLAAPLQLMPQLFWLSTKPLINYSKTEAV
jgi:hypothetical protein